METEQINLIKHELVPEHIKLTEEQKKKILEKYNLALKQMPLILKSDPAIQTLEAKPGDLIMIKRKSSTAGEALYYRVVIDG